MDISHEQLVERWPAKLAQENFGQDAANQAAIRALQQLSAASITPAEAAKQYADAYHDDLASKKITQPWGVLCEAIREFGNGSEHAQRFIDMIKSLSELSHIYGKSGADDKDAYVFWRDLPYLACGLSDFCFGKSSVQFLAAVLTSSAIDTDGLSGYTLATEVRRWRNANTFAALCLRENHFPSTSGMFKAMSMQARWSLSRGLEVSSDAADQQVYIPAAAEYIIIAGEAIHGLCCGQKGEARAAQADEYLDNLPWLWKGPSGFSQGRWEFWRRRFEEISESGLGSDVSKIAASAAEVMMRIESTSSA